MLNLQILLIDFVCNFVFIFDSAKSKQNKNNKVGSKKQNGK